MKELYITHSINQFGELEYVIDAYGAGGYGFYWHLLEKIAKADGALPKEKLERVATEIGFDKGMAEKCTTMLVSLGLVRIETHEVLGEETECYVCDSITEDIGRVKRLSDAGRKAITARWEKYRSANTSVSDTVIRPYANRNTTVSTNVIPDTNTDINTNSNTNINADSNKKREISSSSLKKEKNSSQKKEAILFSDECLKEMNGKYGKLKVLKVRSEIHIADSKGLLRMRDGDALLRSWLRRKDEKDKLGECLNCGSPLGDDQICHECSVRFEWSDREYRWIQKPVMEIAQGGAEQ